MVYVIVLCNLVEFIVGLMVDVLLLCGMCWILKGMEVQYFVKVMGIQYVVVIFVQLIIVVDSGYILFVDVYICDIVGILVFSVCIQMWFLLQDCLWNVLIIGYFIDWQVLIVGWYVLCFLMLELELELQLQFLFVFFWVWLVGMGVWDMFVS